MRRRSCSSSRARATGRLPAPRGAEGRGVGPRARAPRARDRAAASASSVHFLRLRLEGDPGWIYDEQGARLNGARASERSWEPGAGRVRPRPRPRPKATEPVPLVVEADLSPVRVRAYGPARELRTPGDRIEHPTLGLGVVTKSFPGKVEVRFGEATSRLVAGRPLSRGAGQAGLHEAGGQAGFTRPAGSSRAMASWSERAAPVAGRQRRSPRERRSRAARPRAEPVEVHRSRAEEPPRGACARSRCPPRCSGAVEARAREAPKSGSWRSGRAKRVGVGPSARASVARSSSSAHAEGVRVHVAPEERGRAGRVVVEGLEERRDLGVAVRRVAVALEVDRGERHRRRPPRAASRGRRCARPRAARRAAVEPVAAGAEAHERGPLEGLALATAAPW